jgi:hypothetical protein
MEVQMKTRITFVTLLVLLLSVFAVPAFASGDSDAERGDLCHVPRGNPENARVIGANNSSWERHFNNHGGDFLITEDRPCPPDNGGDDGDNGDDDDDCYVEDVYICEDDDDDDDDNGSSVQTEEAEEYVPTLVQITVWPDTQQMEGVIGILWTVNGEFIYDDLNGNGSRDRDPGESEIMTPLEYRDRTVDGTDTVVLNQAMSRLVLGTTVDELGNDYASFLAQFSAYVVTADGIFPVNSGWYDINGEFKPPILDETGYSEYRS